MTCRSTRIAVREFVEDNDIFSALMLKCVGCPWLPPVHVRWYYIPSGNQWVFVSGSQAQITWAPSFYQKFRTPSSANVMPVRFAAAAAIDLKANRIVFFGGISQGGYLSDLW
jgi:hypothetical protein